MTPLHIAVEFGHTETETAKVLLENGATIDSMNNENWTPLHFAAKNGNIETFKLLLRYNADMSLKTIYGKTPYALAQKFGKSDASNLFETWAD